MFNHNKPWSQESLSLLKHVIENSNQMDVRANLANLAPILGRTQEAIILQALRKGFYLKSYSGSISKEYAFERDNLSKFRNPDGTFKFDYLFISFLYESKKAQEKKAQESKNFHFAPGGYLSIMPPFRLKPCIDSGDCIFWHRVIDPTVVTINTDFNLEDRLVNIMMTSGLFDSVISYNKKKKQFSYREGDVSTVMLGSPEKVVLYQCNAIQTELAQLKEVIKDTVDMGVKYPDSAFINFGFKMSKALTRVNELETKISKLKELHLNLQKERDKYVSTLKSYAQ